MVIVDEAWGGHLDFHRELPRSAMAAGADVCVRSTHKLAGGLQQTGLIHWREGRADSELMEAYREYVTTSPS
jgi:arginine decarboxylase